LPVMPDAASVFPGFGRSQSLTAVPASAGSI